nr:MAG TPA: hypothetical protein [Caudoviricetes sp.]
MTFSKRCERCPCDCERKVDRLTTLSARRVKCCVPWHCKASSKMCPRVYKVCQGVCMLV